jgi:hypothetical protein
VWIPRTCSSPRSQSSPHTERNLAMTTILIINAVSSLLAAAGIAAIVVLQTRRARRDAELRVLYVTTESRQQLPRR